MYVSIKIGLGPPQIIGFFHLFPWFSSSILGEMGELPPLILNKNTQFMWWNLTTRGGPQPWYWKFWPFTMWHDPHPRVNPNMAGWRIHHEWSRCISYWKLCFFNVMLVFGGVYNLPIFRCFLPEKNQWTELLLHYLCEELQLQLILHIDIIYIYIAVSVWNAETLQLWKTSTSTIYYVSTSKFTHLQHIPFFSSVLFSQFLPLCVLSVFLLTPQYSNRFFWLARFLFHCVFVEVQSWAETIQIYWILHEVTWP